MYISRKIISFLIILSLLWQDLLFAQVTLPVVVPSYLQGYTAKDKFRPVHLRYLAFNPDKEVFKIILDKGDNKKVLDENTKKLVEYFQIGLRLPNDSFWVNLRPGAVNAILDPELEKTDIGKVLLEADVNLKKDMAGFMDPDKKEGKNYWDLLYKKSREIFGGEKNIVPTLVRPWIVPGEIILGKSESGVYIYKATLKVMLEQDYLKNDLTYNFKDEREKKINEYAADVIREDILKKLTKEINSARRYAALRQVYYSLILAQWFKKEHMSSPRKWGSIITDRISLKIDSKDLTNLTSKESWSKDTYYQQYLNSFKKGEFNKKTLVSSLSGISFRNYTSGGTQLSINFSSPEVNVMTFDPAKFKIKNFYELKECNYNGGVLNAKDDGGAYKKEKIENDEIVNFEVCSECGSEMIIDSERWEAFCPLCGVTQDLGLSLNIEYNSKFETSLHGKSKMVVPEVMGRKLVMPRTIKTLIKLARENSYICLKINDIYEQLRNGELLNSIVKRLMDNPVNVEVSKAEQDKIVSEFLRYAFKQLKLDIKSSVRSNPQIYKEIKDYARIKEFNLTNTQVMNLAFNYPGSWKDKIDLVDSILVYAKDKKIKLSKTDQFYLFFYYPNDWKDVLDSVESIQKYGKKYDVDVSSSLAVFMARSYSKSWEAKFKDIALVKEYAKKYNISLSQKESLALVVHFPNIWADKIDLIPTIKGYADSLGLRLHDRLVIALFSNYSYDWQDRLNLVAEIKSYWLQRKINVADSYCLVLAVTYFNTWKEKVKLYDDIKQYANTKKINLTDSEVMRLIVTYPRAWRKVVDSVEDIENYSKFIGLKFAHSELVSLLIIFYNNWKEKLDLVPLLKQWAEDNNMSLSVTDFKKIILWKEEKRVAKLPLMVTVMKLAREFGLELKVSRVISFVNNLDKDKIVLKDIEGLVSNGALIIDPEKFWKFTQLQGELSISREMFDQFFKRDSDTPSYMKYIFYIKKSKQPVVRDKKIKEKFPREQNLTDDLDGALLLPSQKKYLQKHFSDVQSKLNILSIIKEQFLSQNILISQRVLFSIAITENSLVDKIVSSMMLVIFLGREYGLELTGNSVFNFVVKRKKDVVNPKDLVGLVNEAARIIDKEKFWLYINSINPSLKISSEVYDKFFEKYNQSSPMIKQYLIFIENSKVDSAAEIKIIQKYAANKGLDLSDSEANYFRESFVQDKRQSKIDVMADVYNLFAAEGVILSNTVLRDILKLDKNKIDKIVPLLLSVFKETKKFGLEISNKRAFEFAVKNIFAEVSFDDFMRQINLATPIVDSVKFWKYVEDRENLFIDKTLFDKFFWLNNYKGKNSSYGQYVAYVKKIKDDGGKKVLDSEVQDVCPECGTVLEEDTQIWEYVCRKCGLTLNMPDNYVINYSNVEKEYHIPGGGKFVSTNEIKRIIGAAYKHPAVAEKIYTVYERVRNGELLNSVINNIIDQGGRNIPWKQQEEIIKNFTKVAFKQLKQDISAYVNKHPQVISEIENYALNKNIYLTKSELVFLSVNLFKSWKNYLDLADDIRQYADLKGMRITDNQVKRFLMQFRSNWKDKLDLKEQVEEYAQKKEIAFSQRGLINFLIYFGDNWKENLNVVDKIRAHAELKNIRLSNNLIGEFLLKFFYNWEERLNLSDDIKAYAKKINLELSNTEIIYFLMDFTDSWKNGLDSVGLVREYAKTVNLKLSDSDVLYLVSKYPILWKRNLSLAPKIREYAKVKGLSISDTDVLGLLKGYPLSWEDKINSVEIIKVAAEEKGLYLSNSDLLYIARTYPNSWQEKIDLADKITKYSYGQEIQLSSTDIIALLKLYPNLWEDKINLAQNIEDYASQKMLALTNSDVVFLFRKYPLSWKNILKIAEDIVRYAKDTDILLVNSDITFLALNYPNAWQEKLDSIKVLQELFNKENIELSYSFTKKLIMSTKEKGQRVVKNIIGFAKLAQSYGLKLSQSQLYFFSEKYNLKEYSVEELRKMVTSRAEITNLQNFEKFAELTEDNFSKLLFKEFINIFSHKKRVTYKDYQNFMHENLDDGGKEEAVDLDLCPECGKKMHKDYGRWEYYCPVCGVTQEIELDLSIKNNLKYDVMGTAVVPKQLGLNMVSSQQIKRIMFLAYKYPMVALKINYFYEEVKKGRAINGILKEIVETNEAQKLSELEIEKIVKSFAKKVYQELQNDIRKFLSNNPEVFWEAKNYALNKSLDLDDKKIWTLLNHYPRSWKEKLDLTEAIRGYIKSNNLYLSDKVVVELIEICPNYWEQKLEKITELKKFLDKEDIYFTENFVYRIVRFKVEKMDQLILEITNILRVSREYGIDVNPMEAFEFASKHLNEEFKKEDLKVLVNNKMQILDEAKFFKYVTYIDADLLVAKDSFDRIFNKNNGLLTIEKYKRVVAALNFAKEYGIRVFPGQTFLNFIFKTPELEADDLKNLIKQDSRIIDKDKFWIYVNNIDTSLLVDKKSFDQVLRNKSSLSLRVYKKIIEPIRSADDYGIKIILNRTFFKFIFRNGLSKFSKDKLKKVVTNRAQIVDKDKFRNYVEDVDKSLFADDLSFNRIFERNKGIITIWEYRKWLGYNKVKESLKAKGIELSETNLNYFIFSFAHRWKEKVEQFVLVKDILLKEQINFSDAVVLEIIRTENEKINSLVFNIVELAKLARMYGLEISVWKILKFSKKENILDVNPKVLEKIITYETRIIDKEKFWEYVSNVNPNLLIGRESFDNIFMKNNGSLTMEQFSNGDVPSLIRERLQKEGFTLSESIVKHLEDYYFDSWDKKIDQIVRVRNVFKQAQIELSEYYLFEILRLKQERVDNFVSIVIALVKLGRNYGIEVTNKMAFDFAKKNNLAAVNVKNLQEIIKGLTKIKDKEKFWKYTEIIPDFTVSRDIFDRIFASKFAKRRDLSVAVYRRLLKEFSQTQNDGGQDKSDEVVQKFPWVKKTSLSKAIIENVLNRYPRAWSRFFSKLSQVYEYCEKENIPSIGNILYYISAAKEVNIENIDFVTDMHKLAKSYGIKMDLFYIVNCIQNGVLLEVTAENLLNIVRDTDLIVDIHKFGELVQKSSELKITEDDFEDFFEWQKNSKKVNLGVYKNYIKKDAIKLYALEQGLNFDKWVVRSVIVKFSDWKTKIKEMAEIDKDLKNSDIQLSVVDLLRLVSENKEQKDKLVFNIKNVFKLTQEYGLKIIQVSALNIIFQNKEIDFGILNLNLTVNQKARIEDKEKFWEFTKLFEEYQLPKKEFNIFFEKYRNIKLVPLSDYLDYIGKKDTQSYIDEVEVCSECGNELITDYSRGEYYCSFCGLTKDMGLSLDWEHNLKFNREGKVIMPSVIGRNMVSKRIIKVIMAIAFNETIIALKINYIYEEIRKGRSLKLILQEVRSSGDKNANLDKSEQEKIVYEFGRKAFQQMEEDMKNFIKNSQYLYDDCKNYALTKGIDLPKSRVNFLVNRYPNSWKEKINLYEKIKESAKTKKIELTKSQILDLIGMYPDSYENKIDLVEEITNYTKNNGYDFSQSEIIDLTFQAPVAWKNKIVAIEKMLNYAKSKGLHLTDAYIFRLYLVSPKNCSKTLDTIAEITEYTKDKGLTYYETQAINLLKYKNWKEKVDEADVIREYGLTKGFVLNNTDMIFLIDSESWKDYLDLTDEIADYALQRSLVLSNSDKLYFMKSKYWKEQIGNVDEVKEYARIKNIPLKHSYMLFLLKGNSNTWKNKLDMFEDIKQYGISKGMNFSDTNVVYFIVSLSNMWKDKIDAIAKINNKFKKEDIYFPATELIHFASMSDVTQKKVVNKVLEIIKFGKKYGVKVTAGTLVKFATKNTDILINEKVLINNLFSKKTVIKDFYLFWNLIKNDIQLRITYNLYLQFIKTLPDKKEIYFNDYLKFREENFVGVALKYSSTKELNLSVADIDFLLIRFTDWKAKIMKMAAIKKDFQALGIELSGNMLLRIISIKEDIQPQVLLNMKSILSLSRDMGIDVSPKTAYVFAFYNQQVMIDINNLELVFNSKTKIQDIDKFWSYTQKVSKFSLERNKFDLFKEEVAEKKEIYLSTYFDYLKRQKDDLLGQIINYAADKELDLTEAEAKFFAKTYPNSWQKKLNAQVEIVKNCTEFDVQLTNSVLRDLIKFDEKILRVKLNNINSIIRLGKFYGIEVSAQAAFKFAVKNQEANVMELAKVISPKSHILDKDNFYKYTRLNKDLYLPKDLYYVFFEINSDRQMINLKRYVEHMKKVSEDGGMRNKKIVESLENDNLCPLCGMEWQVEDWERVCPKCGLIENILIFDVRYESFNGDTSKYSYGEYKPKVLGKNIVSGKTIKQLMAEAYNNHEALANIYSIYEQLRQGKFLSRVLADFQDKNQNDVKLNDADVDKQIKDFGRYAFDQIIKEAQLFIKSNPGLYKDVSAYAKQKGLRLTKNQINKLLTYYPRSWMNKIDLVEEIRLYVKQNKIQLSNTYLAELIIRFPNVWQEKLDLYAQIERFAVDNSIKLSNDDIMLLLMMYSNSWQERLDERLKVKEYISEKGIKLTDSDIIFFAIRFPNTWKDKIDAIEEVKEYGMQKGVKLTDADVLFILKRYALSWKEKINLFDQIKLYGENKGVKIMPSDALYLLKNFPQGWQQKLDLFEDIKNYANTKGFKFSDSEVMFFVKGYSNNWQDKINLMSDVRAVFQAKNIETKNSLLRSLIIISQEKRDKIIPIVMQGILLAREYGLQISILSVFDFAKTQEREMLLVDLKDFVTQATFILDKEKFWKYVMLVDTKLKLSKNNYEEFFEKNKKKKNINIKMYLDFMANLNIVKEDGGRLSGGVVLNRLDNQVHLINVDKKNTNLVNQKNDNKWQNICKVASIGIVPLEQLKRFFIDCGQSKEKLEEYNSAYAYVLDVLRLEEEQAVPTSQKLKDVISVLN